MTRIIHFSNICWDTDGIDVDLPSEAVFDVDDDDVAVSDGADFLSNKYGFCVMSYSSELTTTHTPVFG